MKSLDLSFPTPAENLACDEALLDWREEAGGDGILRFWESEQPFVVVGYANKIHEEVNMARCKADRVPICRRCSGGGTVLQGRGCLNYALILEINPELANISSANKYIMERNREAIQSVVGDSRVVQVQGHTDLACAGASESLSPLGERVGVRGMVPNEMNRQRDSKAPIRLFRKFSGNSQRRHKNYLLFHGTFLLDFDLALVGEYLKFPTRQPDYRDSRSHADFLTNLHLPASVLKASLQKIWQAKQPLPNPPPERISKLAREKYATRQWNWKF